MLHAVILAGGSGTRFWPLSRRARPKQFLRIGGERTLLQATAERCEGLLPRSRLWVVTGEAHAAETWRQLPKVQRDHVLIEPCGRNTAPCIGLAAVQLLARDPNAVMLVMPADHLIRTTDQFQRSVEQAVRIVARSPEALVLFGATPTYPATGFGYIRRGTALAGESSVFQVDAFREKPDVATATEFLASRRYFWNCGLFVWHAAAILEEIERHQPEISTRLKRLQVVLGTDRWNDTLAAEFPQMPSISIDVAVLEKSEHVCVVPADFTWDDVGSWQALARLLSADADGNTVEGRFCALDTHGCIIRSETDHLIAAYGVRDLIIVQTPDATLIANKHDESAMRHLLAELERRGFTDFL